MELFLHVTQKTRKAQKGGHHRWRGVWVAALKIVRKLYSKLFKIFGAITDGR